MAFLVVLPNLLWQAQHGWATIEFLHNMNKAVPSRPNFLFWQVLFLNAEDFSTGEEFDATFSGWMWQLYGGVQFPLSGNARLLGEAFLHQGDAEREVDDVLTGATYREIVDLDGAGMRFGLSWGF